VIIDSDRRVLLVKHTYGKLNWELPGGFSEAGEPADATAIREVVEETGLDVRVDRLAGVYYSEPSDMHHFTFICTPAFDSTGPRPTSEEISEVGFFAPDALPRPVSDFTVRRIDDALKTEAIAGVTRIGPRVWFEE
jgi:8-oxo-dGTP diphosphatase